MMDGYVLGPTVMMTLGVFQFSIATAAYKELTRSTAYRWPSQERFGKRPSMQFTGPGEDSITLPGVIYPEYRGGFGQLDAMRGLAGRGMPLTMIDGSGSVLGEWVIERVEDKQTVFAAAGLPRKQEFSLSLKRADDIEAQGLVGGVASAVSGLVASIVPGATGPAANAAAVSAFSGIANTALNNASTLAGKLTTTLTNCTSAAGAIGVQSTTVLSAVTRSIDVANGIKIAAARAIREVGASRNITGVLDAATRLLNENVRLGRIAGNSSSVLAPISASMIDPVAVSAVKGALVNANKLTLVASGAVYKTKELVNKLS